MTIGDKIIFRLLIAHLQDLPNYILKYLLSTLKNVDAVQMINFTEKNDTLLFDLHLIPPGKMKIKKPYVASTGYGQSSPRIS